MRYDIRHTPLSKALLTGLFVGIIDTLLLLIYNVIYRDSTGYSPADFINVSSLIFVENLIFLIIGAIYFLFHFIKKGEILYIILFVLLTAFLIWKTELVKLTTDHLVNVQFRGLLLAVVVVTGISAAFLLPYLYHSRKFQENVI